MADDAQFDPLAGIITPQALQLQRMLQQQQALQQAANAPAVNGRSYYGTRAAGLTLGNAAAQATNGGNTPLDNLARQNASILNAPSGQGQQGPASGDPMEDRARQYEQKAQAFAQAGQYDTAQKFVNAAQIVRKQAQDMVKTQAETYEAQGKGADAFGHLWSTPQAGINPDTGKDAYFQTGPGGAIRWVAPARPQVPQAQVTINQEKPFLTNFASTLDKYKQGADTAVNGLQQLNDAQDKLENGNLILGTGAEARKDFGTFLTTLGFTGSKDAVANTNAFLAETRSMAIASRAQGFSRITNTDLAYLQKIAGGDESLTKDSIKKIFDIRRSIMEHNIDQYNKTRSTLADVANNQKDPGQKQGLQLASGLYPQVDKPVNPFDVPTMTPAQVKAKIAAGQSGFKFKTTDGRTLVAAPAPSAQAPVAGAQ